MKPCTRSLIVIVLFLISTVNWISAVDFGIGTKINFAGGPVPTIVLGAKVKPRVFVNLVFGGFPTKAGPLFRLEVNCRYLFREEERTSYYMQGGYGNTWIRYNEEWQEMKQIRILDIKEFHINGGISRTFSSSFVLSGDVGFLYAPYFVNPELKERFGNVFPIVPMIGFEGIYYIK
ncbi:hypothetical protein KAX75_11675 [candidate division WOR-3 bacterium]|nr:hypothetical protein [candidate division WOR-3 bacterium]